MDQLTEGDYQRLMEYICKMHTFRDVASLRAWLLDEVLPRLIPSDWLSYNEVDLVRPDKTLAILKPENDTLFPQLFPRFCEVIHQHPLITRQMKLDTFPVHKISDFVSQEDFHKLDLYQDVYRLMNVEYQIAATIKLEPERVTAIALARGSADYTERDRAILELLRPHLVVTFNNLMLARAAELKLEHASLALNELSAATIIVSATGKILYHTGHGLEWVDAVNRDSLPGPIAAWLQQTPAIGAAARLQLTNEAGKICLRAVPTASPDRILLVVTRETGQPAKAESPNHFGLSQRELEVATWICQGKTNSEIAAILGISPRTIHKHIEHIFEKTGAESRMALAALLNNLSR